MAQSEGRPASAASPRATERWGAGRPPVCYGALDLGTNNCRLLIATPDADAADGAGFRVVEAFSRIVRLGEGLSHTGRLDEAAMDRALAALTICADKLRRRRVVRVEAVATQACRAAANGAAFVARVEADTGLRLRVIAPEEEARLSVAGCSALLDEEADAALVVDVGGGSTELSWIDLVRTRREGRPHVVAWLSVPLGVVTLAERFPEPEPADRAWFHAMVEHVKVEVSAFHGADALRPLFEAGRAQLIGTSGAITSLAGLHLGLLRYERARIDGLRLTHADCRAAADRLLAMDRAGRAAEPCIGPDRADLVLAGAAILDGVQELWPCARVRVADRGLREGLLMSLMAERRGNAGRTRRRWRRGRASAGPEQRAPE